MADLTFKANLLPSTDLGKALGSSTQRWNIYGNLTGNADTATELSNTPNNTTTFLRGDNTWSNTLTGPIIIDRDSDGPILQTAYQGTNYNTIRNHNNGNVSISATGNGLYVGYGNTNLIDWKNGQMVLSNDNYLGIGTTTPTSKVHINSGLLQITNNDNTVTIGSQNTSCCHFNNSADVPFYFNKRIHAVSGFTIYNTLNSFNSGSIELSGGTPFIDFHYNSSASDYTSRIIENASGELSIPGKLKIGTSTNSYALNCASFKCDSWVRSTGATGWYNDTYGGGWYMTDNTYIRNYGSKQLYLNAQLGVDATLRMWSASRQITRDPSSQSWVNGRNGAILRMTGSPGANYVPLWSCKSNSGSWEGGCYTTNNSFYITYITDTNFNAGTNATTAQMEFRGSDNSFRASKVWGAVWNDYAEFRKDNPEENQEPGRCVREIGDGKLALTTERLMRGCEIISDTFGFAIGQDEEKGYNTPIASNGRVLAYIYEGREKAKNYIGWPVCSGPNGTVSIMTEEEEAKYPSRIIGTISEIPDYEIWGTGEIKVNNRIWIRIR